MSIGIGLGAFMGSFEKGYGMGKQVQADWDDNKQKKEMQGIYDSNKKKFEEGVQAGQFNVGDWDKYATENMYPELVGIHEKRGDYKTAFALKEYLGSQAGIEHGRNFANGLFQYSIGDYHGLATTANKMLKDRGLSGYNVSVVGGDGENPLRYRVSFPGEDGKMISQDMPEKDFLNNFYNRYGNPEYAGLYHAAQKNKAAANAPGLGGVGQDGKDNPTVDYNTAFKHAREIVPPDASFEDIQKMTWKIIEDSRPSRNPHLGIGISQGGQTLVDSRTGQPVSAPSQQPPVTGGNGASAQQPSGTSKDRQQHGYGIESEPLPPPENALGLGESNKQSNTVESIVSDMIKQGRNASDIDGFLGSINGTDAARFFQNMSPELKQQLDALRVKPKQKTRIASDKLRNMESSIMKVLKQGGVKDVDMMLARLGEDDRKAFLRDASPELKQALKGSRFMSEDKLRNDAKPPIGIGERKIPVPKEKPKVTARQDGWLYDEKGHPIGQNPQHPNPSPVPDYAGYTDARF